jgi:hypothetical protein
LEKASEHSSFHSIDWQRMQKCPAVPGLVCSLLGLLLLPVFWSGLPIVLGTAGALLGQAERAGTAGRGLALAAIVVGVAAVVLNILGFLVDRFA